MEFICFGVILIIFILLFIPFFIVPLFKWWMVSNNLIKARSKYLDALGKLRQMPENTSLKQHTILLGQKYINLNQEIIDSDVSHKVKGFIPYDPSTLMKDINDACKNEMSVSNKELQNNQNTEERLKKLMELKAKSMISEQEYEKKRKEILDEI